MKPFCSRKPNTIELSELWRWFKNVLPFLRRRLCKVWKGSNQDVFHFEADWNIRKVVLSGNTITFTSRCCCCRPKVELKVAVKANWLKLEKKRIDWLIDWLSFICFSIATQAVITHYSSYTCAFYKLWKKNNCASFLLCLSIAFFVRPIWAT